MEHAEHDPIGRSWIFYYPILIQMW